MNIKDASIEEVALKEQYVWNCFTAYRYHYAMIQELQKELHIISLNLHGEHIHLTPWQYEALEKEITIMEELHMHMKEIKQVDEWLADIRNENHRRIAISYLINHRCKDVTVVAMETFNSEANVSKVAKNIVRNIAKQVL